jgi:anti-sigma factor RsiW
MSDTWTGRLSEYLDEELSVPEQRALEAHLEECAGCRKALEELRLVTNRAAALQDRPPAENLWSGIAQRIGTEQPERRRGARRRVSFSLPQLAAAGLALILIGAGGAWVALSPGVRGATVVAEQGALPGDGALAVAVARQDYDAAVAQLQEIIYERRAELDSVTVRVIEENLAAIDRAIDEARDALAADPANGYLSQHLAATMRRKVDLLRRAATTASATS